MIAVPIGPDEHMPVVGSPEYSRRHTAPLAPPNVIQHN
jgi:hypothetical protein